MAAITFTTSTRGQLTIDGNNVQLVNAFGNVYRGTLNENGKLVCKGSLSLSVLIRAMHEYRNSTAA